MRYKELDPKVEKKLWEDYKANGSLSAREKLIINYAPTVKYIASRLAMGMPSNVELDDLVSYGIMGLIDAIEKFDLSRGFKFRTYATQRIRGAILDEIRQMDWAPRSVRQKARQLENSYKELESKLGRSAMDHEVAEYMGISLDEFHTMISKVAVTSLISLDNVFSIGKDDDEVSVYDAVEDSDSAQPSEIVERQNMIDILSKSIEELPERERLVLTLYYYEEMNLKEIGQVLGVTESRVSQLHTKAVLRMRSKLAPVAEDFIEELGRK